MAQPETAHRPPFEGVRVIDLSSGIAGGYCTKLLADVGCDVIKVEGPDGDPLRRWSASGSVGTDGEPDGALFRFLNTSKRSVCADVTTADGIAAILDLVAGASVVVENWGPEVAEAYGLGIAQLRTVEPRISLVSLSEFGRGGPMSQVAANEFTIQGWSGSMSLRGTRDRPPLQAGGSTGEWATGVFGALAALTFLQQSAVHGVGEHLDVSMLEATMLTHTTYAATFASYLGQRGVANTRSIELPSIEPASDGWVGFCTVSGQQFVDFAAMVGHPEWAADPAWSTQPGRQMRHDEFRKAVAEWTSPRTVAEIIEEATAWRIPVAPIGTGATIPDMHHFVSRGTFAPNPRGGFRQPVPPYRLSEIQPRPIVAAPRLGEHRDRIEPASPPVFPGRPAWSAVGERDDKPLRGLRIADFTAWWAGPFASHWCASMGADVIHVESPTRPDGMRTATIKPPSFEQWWEWGPIFGAVNSNKRGVAIDLTRSDGRELALELVARCDVVIENYSPRVMEQFGLGWEQLSNVREDLIMVRMPAFGLSGPWRDRTGFAQTMEQISGMAWRTGFPDDQPLIPRGPCDPLAGAHAAIALMAALEHRRRTGRGQLVEVSMVEAALNVAAEVVIEHEAYGHDLSRIGNRADRSAPQGCYRTRTVDGTAEEWICISIENDRQWFMLCEALSATTLGDDPRLAAVDGRRQHHDRIDEHLDELIAGRGRDELVEALIAVGVICSPVLPARCNDELEHPRSRGFFEAVARDLVGTHELWGMPVKPIERVDWSWQERPAPTLGEHNAEVLGALCDVGPSRLEQLRQTGVIGDHWIGARS